LSNYSHKDKWQAAENEQESWATAKMTARCALCMGALKNFHVFLSTPMHIYYSRNFYCAYVPIDPMNVRTKFEVRSFIVPEIIGDT